MSEKKQKYAFVEATDERGLKFFKLFNHVPTHEEVFKYFKKLYQDEVEIVDSVIHEEEYSKFNREHFLNHVDNVATERFGHKLKNRDELIFSFDNVNLNVFLFQARLENYCQVNIQAVDGIILIDYV